MPTSSTDMDTQKRIRPLPGADGQGGDDGLGTHVPSGGGRGQGRWGALPGKARHNHGTLGLGRPVLHVHPVQLAAGGTCLGGTVDDADTGGEI
jgi:hypothetical protein